MKLGSWVVIAVCAAAALAATVWIFGAARVSAPPVDSATPVPGGPAPKAVVDEYMHDFGVMAVYEKRRHTFTIRNEGDAPLILTKGDTTCKCTLSHVAEEPIPPGGSAEVELEWVPRERASEFMQSAKIHTNDPYRAAIVLKVRGRVETVVHLEPSKIWQFGLIENNRSELTGHLYSAVLDEFQIVSLESSNPALTAKFEPLDDETKTRLNAKSGYSITASISGEIPIGKFQASIMIKTDIHSPLPAEQAEAAQDEQAGLELSISVDGARQGPINILGTGYNNSDMSLRMGTFQAREGKKVTLSMFLTERDDVGDFQLENFEITEIHPSLEFLKVTADKDTAFDAEGRQKYTITVEVLPGSPPLAKPADDPATVTFHTNHPDVEKFDISVKFVSQ